MEKNAFLPTVILVDAEYADGVAFDLTVNFERMLMRRIPQANMAQWLVCVALDGGVGQGEASPRQLQVIFLRGQKTKTGLVNFAPGNYADLDGQAFRDTRLGEFLMSVVGHEGLASDDFFVECVQTLLSAEAVSTLILVPDMEHYGAALKSLLAREGRRKQVTLLAMQPEVGRGFQSEILGYSLMHAMGIRGEELGQE
ncbi:MAG: hypothetical protein IJ197_09085 [Bacteroidaceae bacterium]|nr:hypothetical protein [Bacteroidaceae bacterium]